MLYIDDTYEADSDAIRYDTIRPTPVTMQYSLISIRCITMQRKKYDPFYLFGSDRQQIIN